MCDPANISPHGSLLTLVQIIAQAAPNVANFSTVKIQDLTQDAKKKADKSSMFSIWNCGNKGSALIVSIKHLDFHIEVTVHSVPIIFQIPRGSPAGEVRQQVLQRLERPATYSELTAFPRPKGSRSNAERVDSDEALVPILDRFDAQIRNAKTNTPVLVFTDTEVRVCFNVTSCLICGIGCHELAQLRDWLTQHRPSPK